MRCVMYMYSNYRYKDREPVRGMGAEHPASDPVGGRDVSSVLVLVLVRARRLLPGRNILETASEETCAITYKPKHASCDGRHPLDHSNRFPS